MRLENTSKTPTLWVRRQPISLIFFFVMSLLLGKNSQWNIVEAATPRRDRRHDRRRQTSRRNHPQPKRHGVKSQNEERDDDHQRIHKQQQSDDTSDQRLTNDAAERLQGHWHNRMSRVLGTRLWDSVEEEDINAAEAAAEKLKPPRIDRRSPKEASFVDESYLSLSDLLITDVSSIDAATTPPPPNDNCPLAIGLQLEETQLGTIIGASASVPYPGYPSCTPTTRDGEPIQGFWYRFRGFDYQLQIIMKADFDNAKVTLYRGPACDHLECVSIFDFSDTIVITWLPESQEQYYILIHSNISDETQPQQPQQQGSFSIKVQKLLVDPDSHKSNIDKKETDKEEKRESHDNMIEEEQETLIALPETVSPANERNLGETPPPENDICPNAIAVHVGSTLEGTTSNANAGDDLPHCEITAKQFLDASSIEVPGAWYRFKLPKGDAVRIAATPSESSQAAVTQVTVLEGDDCNTLLCLGAGELIIESNSNHDPQNLHYVLVQVGRPTTAIPEAPSDLSAICASLVEPPTASYGGSFVECQRPCLKAACCWRQGHPFPCTEAPQCKEYQVPCGESFVAAFLQLESDVSNIQASRSLPHPTDFSGGEFVLTIESVRPDNDLCTGAALLEVNSTVTGSTEWATPWKAACGTLATEGKGVWYRFESDIYQDQLLLTTFRSKFPAMLTLFYLQQEHYNIDGDHDTVFCDDSDQLSLICINEVGGVLPFQDFGALTWMAQRNSTYLIYLQGASNRRFSGDFDIFHAELELGNTKLVAANRAAKSKYTESGQTSSQFQTETPGRCPPEPISTCQPTLSTVTATAAAAAAAVAVAATTTTSLNPSPTAGGSNGGSIDENPARHSTEIDESMTLDQRRGGVVVTMFVNTTYSMNYEGSPASVTMLPFTGETVKASPSSFPTVVTSMLARAGIPLEELPRTTSLPVEVPVATHTSPPTHSKVRTLTLSASDAEADNLVENTVNFYVETLFKGYANTLLDFKPVTVEDGQADLGYQLRFSAEITFSESSTPPPDEVAETLGGADYRSYILDYVHPSGLYFASTDGIAVVFEVGGAAQAVSLTETAGSVNPGNASIPDPMMSPTPRPTGVSVRLPTRFPTTTSTTHSIPDPMMSPTPRPTGVSIRLPTRFPTTTSTTWPPTAASPNSGSATILAPTTESSTALSPTSASPSSSEQPSSAPPAQGSETLSPTIIAISIAAQALPAATALPESDTPEASPVAATAVPFRKVIQCPDAATLNLFDSLSESLSAATIASNVEGLACDIVDLSAMPGLWYSLAGTGLVLTATLQADLPVEITVFEVPLNGAEASPSCDNLICSNGTLITRISALSSVTTWATRRDSLYFLFVFGAMESGTPTESASDEFILIIGSIFAPFNDECPFAESLCTIDDGTITVNDWTYFATPEQIEDCGNPGTLFETRGLWYLVIGNGMSTTITLTADFDARVSAYEGTRCDSLVCVNVAESTVDKAANVTYYASPLVERSFTWSTSPRGRYIFLVHGVTSEDQGEYYLMVEHAKSEDRQP